MKSGGANRTGGMAEEHALGKVGTALRAVRQPFESPRHIPGRLGEPSVPARSKILLVDNGSLEPESTRQLRRLAVALARRLEREVAPTSLAHSAGIPADRLDGEPAELFEAVLDRALREGVEEIVVVPVFIGPSHAIVRHVPAVIAGRRKRFPHVRIDLAPPLFFEGETRLAEILVDRVRATVESLSLLRPSLPSAPERPTGNLSHVRHFSVGCREESAGAGKARVAVVDHGSPSRAVTAVRDAVAAQVRERLGGVVAEVAACSMERREGAEFDFNEPTLEHLLEREAWRSGPVVVALLFIAPGKHAGPDGDVAQIVRRARGDAINGVTFTPVLGEHPLLVEILADRAEVARQRRG